jgi:uncharacterized protein YyaL (SSP411 family)
MRAVLVAGVVVAVALGAPAQEKGKEDKPKHTNRLAKEQSPYLLMHAHNPTDWYPWGPEAFEKAKKENKLIFLSVGYSSCYWCHVMERECFNHPEVAKLLNQYFVCIKVDREERPDVDQIYMTALTLLQRGRGGWPMSLWLTPDGKPIVGGTYWPREDRMVDGEKELGFKSVCKLVYEGWRDDPKELLAQADRVADAVKAELDSPVKGIVLIDLNRELIEHAVDALKEAFDKEHGGFGNPDTKFRGPKFPLPTRLDFLLQQHEQSKSILVLEMVTTTLDQMAMGGIYDHLGGGFHRYSTERTWTVPHFEKMLYDNAQLVEVYARAYRLTKNPEYKRVVQETLAYVEREMTSPEGAFYSSQDAETHREEGRFYVWTDKELEAALPDAKDREFVAKVFGSGEKYNFEEKYHILRLAKPLPDVAKDLKLSEADFSARLAGVRKKLLDKRSERDRPHLNKIALTAWSGQMIAAYATAGKELNEPAYVKRAAAAAEFVLKHQRTQDGRLLRTFGAAPGQKAKASGNAYLDDYAFLVHGLLNLHDATGEKRWLDDARSLTEAMIKHHGDAKRGGFFFTAHDHEKLFARHKDQYDGAQPSGNSVALRNLSRLWRLTGDKTYRDEAEKGFKAFVVYLKRSPTGETTMLMGLEEFLQDEKKAGEKKTAPEKTGHSRVSRQEYAAVSWSQVGPSGAEVIQWRRP